MGSVYETIGRLAVRFVILRYGRQLRIGAAVALIALLVGGYLAAPRKVEEG